MARVPEYTTQVFLDRANPGNIDAAAAAGGGNAARGYMRQAQQIEETSQSIGQFGDQIAKQREVQGQIKAQEKFNDFKRQQIEHVQTQQNLRMASPDGFAKDIDSWNTQQQTSIEEALSTKEGNEPFDLTYFRQAMDRDRTQTLASSSDWENGMRVQNIAVGTEQGLDQMNVNYSLNNPRLGDLPKQMQEVRNYVNKIGGGVLDPQQTQKFFKYGVDKAAGATIDSMMQNDPHTLKAVMFYGNATKDQLVDMTMFDIEGGDKIAAEPDGTISKFGIKSGQGGLTDAAVRELTPESARAFYNKNWDPRLDKFDPSFRAVAWDAIVNHGNDKNTWDMINKAKGDPYALIQERQKYYQDLITNDPKKYAQYQAGWENRMKAMTSYVQAQDAGGRDFLQHAGLVDPDMINRARAMLPGAIDARDRQDEAVRQQKVGVFNAHYKDLYDTMTKNIEPIGMQELDTLKQFAINTGDPAAIQKADAMANMRTYVDQLKGLGEDQLRKAVRAASAEVNKNPSPDSRLALELTQGVLDNQVKAVQTEGLAYYGRTNQIAMPQPINYGDVSQARNEILSRESSTANIYQRTGKLMPVLTPDEISDLKDKFETMPANEMSGLLSSFDQLDQISKSNLAHAVEKKSPILSTAMAVDDLDTRRRLLFGAKIEPKYDKADMKAQIAQVLDPMVVDPTFRTGAADAVMAYYNSSAQEARDFSGNINDAGIKEAITKIYGPMVDLAFVGTNNVFSFKDPQTGTFVDDGEIYDMFNDVTDEQLTKMWGKLPKGAMGETVTAKDIKDNGRIVSAGDGLYNVVFDNIGGLYDPKGNLVEINGRQLLDISRKDKKKGNNANYPGTDTKAIK